MDGTARSGVVLFRLRQAVPSLIGCLYLGAVSQHWFPKPDAALYLLLRESLRSGRGYLLWGKPEIHVPPGFPALLALLPTQGANDLFCVHFVQSLLVLITILLSWLCLRPDDPTGKSVLVTRANSGSIELPLASAAASLFAFSHISLLLSVQVLSEPLFGVLLWGGTYLLTRAKPSWRVLLAGAFLFSLTPWVRITGFAACGAAVFGLVWEQARHSSDAPGRKARALVAATAIMVLCAGSAGCFYAWHKRVTSAPAHAHLESYAPAIQTALQTEPRAMSLKILDHATETMVEATRLLLGQEPPPFVCALLWLPLLPGLWLAISQGARMLPLLLAASTLPCMIFAPLQERHLWPVAPIALYYWHQGFAWGLLRCLSYPAARRVFCGMACLLVFFHVPKDVRLVVYQRIPAIAKDSSHRRALERAAAWLAGHAEATPFLAPAHARELAYLSGAASSAEGSPSIASINALENWYGAEYQSLIVFKSAVRPQFARVAEFAECYAGHRLVLEQPSFRIYRRIKGPLSLAQPWDGKVNERLDAATPNNGGTNTSSQDLPE